MIPPTSHCGDVHRHSADGWVGAGGEGDTVESHEPYVVGHVDAMFGEFAERADRYGVRHAQFSCSRWRELSCEA